MSSTNVGSEQIGSTERLYSIPDGAEADSSQRTTVGTNTAANNQTGNEQDGSNSGDVSQESSDKQDGDVLPHLYNEGIFESSYYFKEIEEKYNDLDDREKLCLLCFAIFPENAEIKKRLLRFWWVGENLVPADGAEDEMELVNRTLETFVKKGFIEPVQKKNKLAPSSYKMNPIVHSCIIKFAKVAQFFDYDPKGKPTMNFSSCKKACMVKNAPVGWFFEEKEPRSYRLSTDLEKLQVLFNFPDPRTLATACKRMHELQTLFKISEQFPDLPTEWFCRMTGLKVLYLGRWETSPGCQRHIEEENIGFLKGLKNMKKLRLLSLQGISGISELPSSLCKLENLRILDLRACHNLEKLPEKMGSLKKLTHLDLSECYLLDDMPKRLNQLWELRVLQGFVIGDGENSCTLEDLSELKNLGKLSVKVNTAEFNIDDAGKALSEFQKLRKLTIAWGSRWSKGTINSTQGSGVQQSDPSNPNEGQKQEKDAVTSRNKNQKGSARKSSTNKENNGSLGKLVKLELQCFPRSTPPDWLVPEKMIGLKILSIRAGRLSHLFHEGGEWQVDTLRLKFLMDFKMNWKEMLERFPKLNYLEKVRCPTITFCPCDVSGVWLKSSK